MEGELAFPGDSIICAIEYGKFEKGVEVFHSPLDGMLVHISVNSPAAIYTPEWREAL